MHQAADNRAVKVVSAPRKIEAVLFLILAIAFLAISQPRVHLALLNAVHHSDLWEKRSEAVKQIGVVYGAAFLILAMLSAIGAGRGGSLTRRVAGYFGNIPRAARELMSSRRGAGIVSPGGAMWMAATVAVGAGIRAYFLKSPMKWDESFTFFGYVQSPLAFVFEYTAPNNHVLSSILERVSTLALGKNPIAIRLPAFLAGVAAIPLSFSVCRALRPGWSGYFAAAAVAVWPYLIYYSANGRGYSPAVLLALLLVLVGLEYANHPTRGGVGLIAVTSALALYTMPSMLFMVVGAGVWIIRLLVARGGTLKSVALEFAIPCGGLTAGLTLLLYTPVVLVTGGFEYILRNRFVRPQPWGEFFGELGPHVRDTAHALASGVPRIVLAVVVILIIAGLVSSARRRDRAMFMLLPLVLAASLVVLIGQHHIPFERTWIFLLPVMIVTADAGFAGLLESSPRYVRPAVMGALLVAAVLMGRHFVALQPTIRDSTELGEDFPEARAAAQFLKPLLREGDGVRTSLTAEEPTFFYLWYDTTYANPRTHKAVKPQIVFCMGNEEGNYSFMWYHNVANPREPVTTEPGRTFYVVKKSECSLDTLPDIRIFVEAKETLDLPANSVIKLLDQGDMAVYQRVDGGSSGAGQ